MNNTSLSSFPLGMTPVSSDLVEIMLELLSAYLILFISGSIGVFINALLLTILFRIRSLQREWKLMICLAVGDLVNCLALALLGFDRYTLFLRSLTIRMVPLETSLSCAARPYIWFRIIGNICPPTTLMVMGVERLFACMTPFIYMKHIRSRSIYFCLICVIIVLVFCAIGLALAIINNSKGYVKFDCGRKATFSLSYAQTVYFWEMLGYFFGLLLNVVAFLRARSFVKTSAVKDQLVRVRTGLVLGLLATVLVSLPNVKSLFLDQLRNVGMDEWLSQMFNWASIINSSINIVIYLKFCREFRYEFGRLLRSG